MLERAHHDDPAKPGAARAGSSRAAADGRARVAVVGMSVQSSCGVRDHAALLAGALERGGVECTLHWLSRDALALRRARAQVRTWSAELRQELERSPADAVLLHYSPFSYAYRGVPLLLHPVLSAIGAARIPTLCIAHELAYPWGRAGWRGRVWAATQRASLFELVSACSAMIVTADFQERWLSTRVWLPARATRMAPVFSNLPPPGAPRPRRPGSPVIGVFGYAYQGAEASLVLDAVALLKRRGLDLRLALLGAPGRSSEAAEEWLGGARARGVEELLSFDGPLPAQQLSDELAGCELLVSCARLGPSSRKGTLAGSLASGAPVVALDGPRRWDELVQAGAVEVVQPTPQALADALEALLADEPRRAALGARGRRFAESQMSISRTAAAVSALLDQLLRRRAASAVAAAG